MRLDAWDGSFGENIFYPNPISFGLRWRNLIKTMVSSCLPVFLSSEITFNLLICLIPIALLLFALLGTYLYSDQEVLNHIGRYFENSFPSLDPTIMENILRIIRDRKIVGILGIGGLIWTSTWVFSSLRTALNIVFKVEKGRNIVKGKAIDLFMILLAGIFLLLSMVFTSLITIIPKYHFRSFPEMSVIFRFVLKYPIPFLFTFWMFFLIYKIIPIRKFTSKLLYKHPFLPVFCGRLRSKYLHGMSYILEDSR